jgi:hypothetical protein
MPVQSGVIAEDSSNLVQAHYAVEAVAFRMDRSARHAERGGSSFVRSMRKAQARKSDPCEIQTLIYRLSLGVSSMAAVSRQRSEIIPTA